MKTMENAWNEAELIHQSNVANMDPSFQEAKQKEAEETVKAQKMMEENWQNRLEDYEKEYANQ